MDTPSPRRETVEQLAEEFVERYRRGERPPLSEYIARHPEHAAEIRDLFPALVVMEQVAPESDGLLGETGDAPRLGPIDHPQRLGDYRLLREVGRGGMGVVYEAEQVSLGRHVALKVLPQSVLMDDRSRKRFDREARSAARLHHTNIVPVFGIGEEGGLHYYVMQFIHGLGLDAVLEELRFQRQGLPRPAPTGPRAGMATEAARSLLSGEFRPVVAEEDGPGPAPAGRSSDAQSLSASSVVLPGQSTAGGKTRQPTYWQSVARVGVQVAGTLAHAHSQGILHRDVKPSNLLLDVHGHVWVTDFGLAKASDQEDLTHTGDVVGTLRYMAPEVFDGKHDARSEVCSLGLTLYELLALRSAFDETDRGRLIRQVTTADPPRLRKLRPDVPRDLATVVEKAIDRDPARRYQTAQELADDLGRFLDDEPIVARRSGPLERTWRWCRRNPRVAGLVGLVLLLLVLLGVGGVTAAVVFSRQAAQQKRLTDEATAAKGTAETARTQALEAQARAEAEAAAADQVSGFLVGLFEPRDRLALGALSLGYRRGAADALSASDLLARGVRRLQSAAELKDRPLVRARLLHEIGTIHFGMGEPDAAAPLLDEALALRRGHLPAGHADLAASLRGVAQVRYLRGDLSAVDLYREAIAILKTRGDAGAEELAETEVSLAVCLYHLLGEQGEPFELMGRALESRRRRLGGHDLRTLTTAWLLAYLHMERGEFLKAMPLLVELQGGLERSQADPELAACVREAAEALKTRVLRGPAAALPLWRKAVDRVRRVFGEHHYLSVKAVKLLADSIYFVHAGSDPALGEAVTLYRQALAGLAAVRAPLRLEQAAARLDLGRALMRLRRGPEAEPELRQAVALYREVRPEQQTNLPHALQMLAWTLERSKEPRKQAEVEALLDEALSVSRTSAVAPYRLGHALMDVGRYHLARGDTATSIPLFAEAARVRRQALGPTHIDVAEALAFWSLALRRGGKAQEAEAPHREAEQVLRHHTKNEIASARRARMALSGELPPWP